ncbi:hypothetical protein [Actinokineospora auranticolor]|uniref:DUF7019 family protein n=1 Tax=Actinokineospora auranticolor TaxID=155976 RepID=UPI0026882937
MFSRCPETSRHPSPGYGGKRKAEFGVDLKVLTAKRTAEAAGPDRVARLERVVGFLRAKPGVRAAAFEALTDVR